MGKVRSYIGVVMILNFIVTLLLLFGAGRIGGGPPTAVRAVFGALISGVYCGMCMTPEFSFLAGTLWQIVFLALILLIGFGISRCALRCGAVFCLLQLSLYGITTALEKGAVWVIPAGVAAVLVVSRFALGGKGDLVPVELQYQDKHLQFTALNDTGNTLKDPITGSPVLVVGSEIAGQLLGLTQQQLKKPAETMTTAKIPGLRLGPFRTIGQSGGLMLALRLKEVKIGSWKGSSLVAFAPEGLSRDGGFQGLSGGYV